MIDRPVSQFMDRDVLIGDASTKLHEVVAEMESAEVSAYVVCENRIPIGIITEHDTISLLHRSLNEDTTRSLGDACAADVMTRPVESLRESATMGQLMDLLRESGFRRVPIVDRESRIVGIVDLGHLQAATNNALERRGRELEVEVMKRTAELQLANQELEKLSQSDGLTGLLNRRALATRLDELYGMSVRYGARFSIALVDIDHFKNFNDTLGHVAGDQTIKAIARILVDAVRTVDLVFRYGGEEFLIALPETDATGAAHVAERIRQQAEAAAIAHPDSTTSDVVTLSIGHTTLEPSDLDRFESWTSVVENADAALYRAKQSGRNCVVGADSLDSKPDPTRARDRV